MHVAEIKRLVDDRSYDVDPALVAEAVLRRLDLEALPPVPLLLSPRGARSRPGDAPRPPARGS
jgi:hypothetical protein